MRFELDDLLRQPGTVFRRFVVACPAAMLVGVAPLVTWFLGAGLLTASSLRAQEDTVGAVAEARLESSVVVDPFLRIERQDDIELLYLRGTAEERARALGAHRMPEIVELFESFALAPQLGLSPLAWGLAVLPKSRRVLADLEPLRQHYAWMIAGAESVLGPDGTMVPAIKRSLSVDDMMAVTLLPDFLGLGCSSFAAWGDEVEGDGPVVGRNLDYFGSDVMLEQSGLVVHAPLGDRAGWVSVGWAGLQGCLTGVSDRGVSVAIHDVGSSVLQERRVQVVPRIVALQELVERLVPGPDVVEQAEAILEEQRFGYGGNVMVGWKGGDGFEAGAAVFELHAAGDAASVSDEVVARLPEPGQTWVACTNHFRACEHPESCFRYLKVERVLEPVAEELDFDAAVRLIGEPQVRSTLYQTIVDLEAMRLSVRVRRADGGWDASEFSVSALVRGAQGFDADPEGGEAPGPAAARPGVPGSDSEKTRRPGNSSGH